MVDSQSREVDSLLGDLEGSARQEHAGLVTWLLKQGITVEKIRTAPMPMLLASRRIVGDDDDYVSTRQVSEDHGVDVELVQRLQHAAGLARGEDPDAAVHLRADGDTAVHIRRFLDAGLDPEALVQIVHVVTEGLSPAAEVMRSTALATVLRPGATELEIAQQSHALVDRLAPLLGPWIVDMLFMQLRHRTETEDVTAGQTAAGSALPDARNVTVAFADLAGFTRLGQEVSAEQLETFAHRLTERARGVAVAPVRFIKTIGDAVMFICTGPGPGRLLDAVLKLLETVDTGTDGLQLRAGAASGPAVNRASDWFGSPVNIASRVAAAAQPGTVLITEWVQKDLDGDDGFNATFAGAHDLKGLSDRINLFRARRDGNAR